MDKLQELQSVFASYQKTIGDRPTKQEVANLVRSVLDFVKGLDLKKTLSGELRVAEGQMLERVMKQVFDEAKKIEKKNGEDIDSRSGKTIKELRESVRRLEEVFKGGIEDTRNKIPKPTNLEPIFEKIGNLKERMNSRDKEVNKEFDDLKEEIKKMVTRPTFTGGASRRVFQPKRSDLSSQCDGSNKTFYLDKAPLDDGTLMVFGTDFPGILRPTIDFTIANKILTLTSAVPAPNEGATLICTYFA